MIGGSLRTRRREAEWMDEPGADPELLRRSLAYIRAINRLFGYTRSTLSHLDRFARTWTPGRPVHFLDVATGSADVPRAVLAWAESRNLDVRVTAVDLHAATAAEAAASAAPGRLRVVRADALRLPFPDGAFDYAMTSMFLHHLDDDDVVRVLSEMGRVARRGVLAADLVRNRRALFWIHVFTLFANPMVKHDAVVSVRQAFRRDEIESLARRANIPWATYHPHPAHRFVLAGEKP